MRMVGKWPDGAFRFDRETAKAGIGILWILRGLACAALGISIYLGWIAISSGTVVGCGDVERWDCGVVLQSHWSKFLGIPVSVPASIVYVAMLVALGYAGSHRESSRRLAWSCASMIAVLVAGSAVWFMSVQYFVIQGLCLYCVSVHSIGLFILLMILACRPFSFSAWGKLSAAASVGLAVLIMGQVFVEPAPTHEVEEFSMGDDPVDSGDPIHSPDEDLLIAPSDVDVEVIAEPDRSDGDGTAEQTASGDSASNGLFGLHWIQNMSVSVPMWSLTTVLSISSVDNQSHGEDGPSDHSENSELHADATKQPKKRFITILGKRARINVYQWPVIGSPDAEHVLVELFDYTCSHCRTMHRHVKVAHERFGNQLAIVTLPVPMNSSCNEAVARTSPKHRNACELARYALAVWRRRPDAFSRYHDWLFEPISARSTQAARAQAADLIGDEVLARELESGVLDKYIKGHVTIYKRANRGKIPKLLHATFTMTGESTSADVLCNLLERRLGIASGL